MTWWHYLLLANIYLILFFGFYALFLRKETFFQMNRVYLVSAAVLSFLIPGIQADWVKNLFITQRVHQTIYNLEPVVIYQYQPAPDHHFTLGQGMAFIYVAGILFLVIRLGIQLFLLRRHINKPDQKAAFAFFKKIRLGEEMLQSEAIMTHEKVHAAQWHSADVLLIELVMIFNWFNPVIYFYRRAIKHIHEFIADREAVTTGTSKAEYAMLLFTQTFQTQHSLVNSFFNRSLLKQRVMMLQKDPSRRIKLVKYGLSAPLFALMLILSSATVNNSRVITIIHKKAQQVFSIPADSIQTMVVVNDIPGTVKPKHDKRVITVTTTLTQAKDSKEQTVKTSLAVKPDSASDGPIFAETETSPQFPGGMQKFYAFLGQHIHYPDLMRENNVQGRIVVSFIVEKDGSLTNFKVLRDIGSGAGEEAVRVLSLCPKWEPAMQNGQPARCRFAVPVNFALGEATTAFRPTIPLKPGLVFMPPPSLPHNDSLRFFPKTTDRPRTFIYLMHTTENGKTDTVKGHGVITFSTRSNTSSPLYFIDGKETTSDKLKTFSAASIDRVSVIKGDEAIKEYGARAINGVVMITTGITKGLTTPDSH